MTWQNLKQPQDNTYYTLHFTLQMIFLFAKMIYNIFVKCLVFYNVNLYKCIYELFHILFLCVRACVCECMCARVCVWGMCVFMCVCVSARVRLCAHMLARACVWGCARACECVGGRTCARGRVRACVRERAHAKCCGSVEWMEVPQDTVHWHVSIRMVTTPQVLRGRFNK